MDEKNSIQQIFFRWIKSKGLYSQYKNNLIEAFNNNAYPHYSSCKNFNKHIVSHVFGHDYGIIDRSFTWSYTKEGDWFWNKVDSEWNQFWKDNFSVLTNKEKENTIKTNGLYAFTIK